MATILNAYNLTGGVSAIFYITAMLVEA